MSVSVCTALEEEHVVVVGHLEELADVGDQLLHHGLDGAIGIAVGALHEVHAKVVVILKFILGLVKNFLKDARGTSREVVRALGALSAAACGGDVVDGAFDIVFRGGGDRGAGGNDAQIDDDGSDGRNENYFLIHNKF